jgi:hypothetical protein
MTKKQYSTPKESIAQGRNPFLLLPLDGYSETPPIALPT